MVDPEGSAGSFRANIQAMVRESVGKHLINEGLDTFDKERDEALRHIPASAKPIVWFTEQNQLYNAKCQEYLENVRPELHYAVDVLIDSLEEKFVTGSYGQKEDVSLRTPQTSRPASNGPPTRSGQVGVFGPSQPRAPEAAMDALFGEASSPTRSATLLAEDSRPVANRDVRADLFINTDVDGNGTESGSPVASPSGRAPARACAGILPAVPDTSSASKRQPGDEEIPEGSKKRPRLLPPNTHDDLSSVKSWTTKLKPINMDQVKPDECVFRYRRLPGFYVLRCNRSVCKAKYRTNDDVFYFRAHPFQRSRAMNHFRGEGHSIREEEAIFRSYAREVSDATEQRNLCTSKARQPHTPKMPNSELPGPSDMAFSRPATGAPLTPATSPSTSRNKGKQPGSYAGMDFGDDNESSFDGEDAERLQSSGSTVAEALTRSQPYPTRSRVSIPDDKPMEIIDDSDEDAEGTTQDMECLSLGKWPRSARRFAPV
ncbi:hypothetical protein PG993_009876 [Apiospora rasikravindrae]|uniref:Uncharacterized protein n=1 Tax=Apiospora rasikravindrae TaxID=990691 RepID=A0ABR1SM01_9PEZI